MSHRPLGSSDVEGKMFTLDWSRSQLKGKRVKSLGWRFSAFFN